MKRVASPFRLATSSLALLLLLLLASAATTQPPESDERADSIRADYSKLEARIPMRDGVRLFTTIYVPNDLDGWVDNIFEADADDFVEATHTIYRSPELPSRVEVRILPTP